MTTSDGGNLLDLIGSDVLLLVLVLVRNEVRPISWTVEGGLEPREIREAELSKHTGGRVNERT
jgi:hypothetical protein